MKYSKKTVYDYIVGNEINGHDIDELEKDVDFMREVIKMSNDKKMYNFCDEIVKNDYDFITFVINKFSNDKDFIVKVSEEYKKNNEAKKEELIDLAALVNKHLNINLTETENKYYSLFSSNTLMLNAEYYGNRVITDIESISNNDDVLQMGFILFIDLYGGFSNALDYFAKMMINEIFEDVKLEKFLHQKVRNLSYLKEVGIKKYLIDYLKCHDEALSDYLTVHPYVLNDIEKKALKCIDNWDRYIKYERKMLIESIIIQCESYFNNIDPYDDLFDAEVLMVLAKEFNCFEEVRKNYMDLYNVDIFENIKENNINLDFEKMKHYLKLKPIFEEKLKNDKEVYDSYVDDEKNNKKINSKIISIKR